MVDINEVLNTWQLHGLWYSSLYQAT